MRSFDNQGNSPVMVASLKRPGILKLGDEKMRSVLTLSKDRKSMIAKWYILDKATIWKAWMKIELEN